MVLGPPVSLVDTVACDDADALPGGVAGLLRDRSTPLVVTGLAQQWPLYDRWSFERLGRHTRCVRWVSGHHRRMYLLSHARDVCQS